MITNLIERLHERFGVARRARILSARLAAAIPPGCQRVLDLGCGDGRIARLLAHLRPELEVRGIDILARGAARQGVQLYDGRELPFETGQFDIVLLVDVLHHAQGPLALLREAVRVARDGVILKDHRLEGPFAGPRLRFMDRVGNQRFGVPLPFNYWRRSQWQDAFDALGLAPEDWRESLGLYLWPLSIAFDGTLQFMARCAVGRAPAFGAELARVRRSGDALNGAEFSGVHDTPPQGSVAVLNSAGGRTNDS